MKKCKDCNVEMIEGLGIRADESASIDNKSQLYLVTNENDYFGRRVGQRKIGDDPFVKCRVCPSCGKVELFVDPNILKEA